MLEAILISKKFIPLYLEHRKFLILRHFTFEQSRFKKYFIIMMQKSRQKAKITIEKDFYKFLNNANFEYHCTNNLDDCKFETIYNEIIINDIMIFLITRFHNL